MGLGLPDRGSQQSARTKGPGITQNHNLMARQGQQQRSMALGYLWCGEVWRRGGAEGGKGGQLVETGLRGET